MAAPGLWSRTLTAVGGIAMLVGAIDPLEGALLILPGSGLVALGAFLGGGGRRLVAWRVLAFAMIAVGVGAMWGLSTVGGIGGSTGRSPWWGALILPYLVGWWLGIWGPGSPRWMQWLGILVGCWYLVAVPLILTTRSPEPDGVQPSVLIALAAFGALTIAGCVYRLRKPASE